MIHVNLCNKPDDYHCAICNKVVSKAHVHEAIIEMQQRHYLEERPYPLGSKMHYWREARFIGFK